jgi:Protein of unknown function (DUF3489)
MTTKARRKTRKTSPKLRAKRAVAAPQKPANSAILIRPPAPMSKQGQLIALLEREQGATIAEAADALHWQAHSVRGVMSGVLKKKLQLKIQKLPSDGSGTRYRLVD